MWWETSFKFLFRRKMSWFCLKIDFSVPQVSEERRSRLLEETQEQHVRDVNKMPSMWCASFFYVSQRCSPLHDCPICAGSSPHRKDQPRCRKECTEALSKLQKKNQELQRHLEKACRQLQHSIREHKTTMQRLKGTAVYCV